MSTTSTIPSITTLPQLHLDTTWPSPEQALVAVVREVDLATAPALRDRLLNVLRQRGLAVLEVDLTGEAAARQSGCRLTRRR